MSEVKIYDGITINMSTSEVISHGEITYADSNKVSHLGGGSDKSQTTTSGVADKAYEQYVSPFLKQAQAAQQAGDLSKVAGFNQDQLDAQAAARKSAGAQTGLEQLMAQQASAGVDLSGMKTAATTDAQKALGSLAGAAGRTGNLGGSRQALNQVGLTNDLAAKFAGIDLQKQQQDMAMKQAALGAQGTGAGMLGQIGAAGQQQSQAEADAQYQGLSRLGGMFGVLPKSSTTTQSGGK
tara:strand:- start:3683 stop:4396 length:714 start_codon:yes stop_codon:yes gene_type:complete